MHTKSQIKRGQIFVTGGDRPGIRDALAARLLELSRAARIWLGSNDTIQIRENENNNPKQKKRAPAVDKRNTPDETLEITLLY